MIRVSPLGFDDQLRASEAQLRAATELVGLGIYAWDPVAKSLEWDERVCAMWGLPPHSAVNWETFEAGIHPDDLERLRKAIAACSNANGDGEYDIQLRVIGHEDGIVRHIATSGRMNFEEGRAVFLIGAAFDVTLQHDMEDSIRASEAQFRSFAEYSSNLIWMTDPGIEIILYRSPAFEKIWGIPRVEAPTTVA